jgi:hypothetical protein
MDGTHILKQAIAFKDMEKACGKTEEEMEP